MTHHDKDSIKKYLNKITKFYKFASVFSDFLDNRRILLLAKKVGSEWEPLGKALGVADEEIEEIKEGQDGLSYHGGFKMLWAWRQAQPNNNEDASCVQLRQALQQVNKEYLLEDIAVN